MGETDTGGRDPVAKLFGPNGIRRAFRERYE